MERFIQRLNDYKLLRENIERGDVTKVKHFIENYPKENHAYNAQNESAVAVALKTNQLEIYELLIQNGFQLGPHEDLSEFLNNDELGEPPAKKGKIIFKIHKRCALDSKLKHLSILCSKCKLTHTAKKTMRQKYHETIRKVFEELNEIAWIELLLKFVACSAELCFIFDFENESVVEIDPRKHSGVYGVTYPNSCIIIGAKGLLLKNSRCKVHGTLAHEICHYAIDMLFTNSCKPYPKDDSNLQKIFETIAKICRLKKSVEGIIKRAFESDHVHAELIARVPHLLALYKNQPQKLEEVKEAFKELFEFFEQNVLKKLRLTFPQVELNFIIKEINKVFGVFDKLKASKVSAKLDEESKINLSTNEKVQVFTTNCCHLTMKLLFEEIMQSKMINEFIFMKLDNLENARIFEMLNFPIKPTVIIDCDGKKSEEVEGYLSKFMKFEKMILVVDKSFKYSSLKVEKIEHSWSQLTGKSQEDLLKIPVNFQGAVISLEVFCQNDESLLDNFPLNDLIKGKEIKIAKENKFEEIKIHIERKFLSSGSKWNRKTRKFEPDPLLVDEILTKTENLNTFLLADEVGNGKSTEFKMMSKKLKRKFPLFWVEYIDLKLFTKVFEKDGKVSMSFDGGKEISRFLAEKILNLKTFEMEVFVKIFGENRVIFLMDGVDEISPSYKEFVMKLMLGIKENSKNQLFIATRPHLVRELERSLKTRAFKLTPFSDENRREFYNKFLEGKNVEIAKRKTVLDSIEKFVETLERHSWRDTISNPMLIRMIAELIEDDFDFQLADSNLFSIYDNFVNKMIGNLARKGSEAASDAIFFMRMNIIECHQKRALEVMLETDENSMNLCFRKTPKLPVDKMVRIGLLFDDGTGELNFFHRTFAEFFTAQFIFEKVFKQNFQSQEELEAITKFWLEAMTMGGGRIIRKFLDEELRNFEFDSDCESSKLVLESIERRFESDRRVLGYLAKDGCMNLIEFVTQHVIQDRGRLQEIWLKCGYYGSVSALMITAQFQSIDFVEKLWKFAAKTEKLQIKNLLIHEDKHQKNVLHYAVRNEINEKAFEFLLTKAREMLNENELKLFLEPQRPFWDSLDANAENILNRFMKNFTVIELKTLFLSTNENGATLLHDACRFCDSKLVQFIVEKLLENFGLKETRIFFLKKTNEGETLLMFAAWNKNENSFATLWNFIEARFTLEEQFQFLMEGDKNGWNAFNYATRTENSRNFQTIAKFYENNFDSDQVKEILVKENEKDENILHEAMKARYDNKETAESLWNFMQTFLDYETLKKMLVQRSKNGKSVFDGYSFTQRKIRVFESFIVKTCTKDDSHATFQLWHLIVVFFRIEFIKELATIVDKNSEFASSFYQKLFQFRDKNNENIWNALKKTTRKQEILSFLLERARLVLKNLN